MINEFLTKVILFVAVVVVAVLLAVLWATGAFAHGKGTEFIVNGYPGCCGKQDCRPAVLRYVPGKGFAVIGTRALDDKHPAIRVPQPILIPLDKWTRTNETEEPMVCFHLKMVYSEWFAAPVKPLTATGYRCAFLPGGA